MAYDPKTFRALTYFDHVEKFRDGTDSPRAYLERCLATIAEREPVVKALPSINEAGARAAADASTARWKDGKPLSAIDGMPVGIKDLLETKDMPTEMGCAAFKGNWPKRDNAAVWALRQAGAIVLAKTVTAELGGSHPGPTTNPFDVRRTPGGSSSGSAAAVAAKMMPAAIGTQVGGSIIRPAAYCGNYALKPTQGAINRGERQATSMSTHGPHAGSIEDMWQVAIEISRRAGGDRGSPGLFGFRGEGLPRGHDDIEPPPAHGMQPEGLAGDALEPVAIHRATNESLGHGKSQPRQARRSRHHVQQYRRAAQLAGRVQHGRKGAAARETMAPRKASLPGAAGHAPFRPRRACGPWRDGR